MEPDKRSIKVKKQIRAHCEKAFVGRVSVGFSGKQKVFHDGSIPVNYLPDDGG